MVRVAAGTARQALGVPREPGAHGGDERREDAVVAPAEVDAREDLLRGLARLGGLGELDEEGVAADLERRRVEALRLLLAPVPDGVQDTEAGAAQALAAADAPVVLRRRGEAGRPGLDLGAALLLQPVHPVQLGELAREQVAQGGQVPDVEGGVVEQLGRDGPRGPVGLLARLVDGDAEMVLQQRPEADAGAAEELRGQHGVEDALGPEAVEVVQEPQVEVAAVHQQVLGGEPVQERLELQARGQHVDEEDLAADQELHEADPGLVVVHVVGLGIEGDLGHAVERGQQRRQGTGLIEQLVGGRTGSHFDAEQTANLEREEAGNHAAGGGFSHAERKASINKGRSSL